MSKKEIKVDLALKFGYIKIKPWKAIKKTIVNGETDGIFFRYNMRKLCNHILKVDRDRGRLLVTSASNFLDFKNTIEDTWGEWHEKWFEVCDENGNVINVGNNVRSSKIKRFAKIDVDLANSEEARKLLEDKIQEYESRHNWTEREIEKAKALTKEKICELFEKGLYTSFLVDKKEQEVSCLVSFCKQGFSKCEYEKAGVKRIPAYAESSGNDVPNQWIGKCVAIHKAMNLPVPDFIMNKNRK